MLTDSMFSRLPFRHSKANLSDGNKQMAPNRKMCTVSSACLSCSHSDSLDCVLRISEVPTITRKLFSKP